MPLSSHRQPLSPSVFSDQSTDTTAFTPTTSVAGDQDSFVTFDDRPPRPGKTYIIRTTSDGRELTLLHGRVVLAPPGSLGSAHWSCVEHNGWLGFQNVATAHFLGHNGRKPGLLHCEARGHSIHEHVHVNKSYSNAVGYTIRAEYKHGTRPVGIRVDRGEELLDRLYDPDDEGLVWNFVEVS